MTRHGASLTRAAGGSLGTLLIALLALPLVALVVSVSANDLAVALADPRLGPAVRVSLFTSTVSLAIVMATGTPLAWWLASSRHRLARICELLVHVPIVVPPAVVGVALLAVFGRDGALGPALARLGLALPFTVYAVILAQVVVSAPFFVQAAANAFRDIDPDTVVVARTLGASPSATFVRIVLPMARPGLLTGAGLAWARAVGEFGATLLFAGNREGVTQTMPLAIFSALESDVQLAIGFSLMLVVMGGAVLVGLRSAGRLGATKTHAKPRPRAKSSGA
ncbi:MAG: molybdate ABC transporter permease subunit [Myxococcales bacterium FL481]|nr:MAG: molybdate ABC transporter permease subunit [Myxococcales bacterium FL481]